jgi:hypothetical protein
MTTLTLDKVAVAPVSDLSAVVFLPQTTETFVDAIPSEVRIYAGGRRRAVTRPGASRNITLTLRQLDRDDYDTLAGYRGQVMLVRDQRGRAVYGVFSSINGAVERDRPTLVMDVTVAFSEVTVSEIV